MARLPSLTAQDSFKTASEGDLILVHPETRARTVVPIHSDRTIKEPLLRVIIRDAGLTSDEFL